MSKKLDTSLAYLQIQLGVNVCPLDLVYDDWHYLASLSWVKMLWRTLQVTGFEIYLDYGEIVIPRKRDFVLREKFMESTSGDVEEMKALSRVQGSLNTIFFADIVTADGKYSAHFEHDVAVVNGKPEILSTFDYIYEALGLPKDSIVA